MVALVVDQSSNSGYAIENTRPNSLHKHGLIELPKGDDREGEMFFALYSRVRRLIEAEKITEVYFEQTFIPPPKMKGDRMVFRNQPMDYFQQHCLTGVVMMAAAEYRIPYYQVLIADWRYYFIKVRSAPAHIRKQEDRRNWLKDEVIRECQRRGYDVLDDNVADALGMLHYVLWCRQAPEEAKGPLL